MKHFIPGISVLLLSALFPFCISESQNFAENYNVSYNLDRPDEKYSLPPDLSEISGIIYDEGKIFCIQDESADIFVFDLLYKKVVSRYSFGIKGDCEDLAVTGQDAYILKSNGSIIMINGFKGNNKKITVHETPLSSENDTEGLTFEASSNSLIIACKGHGNRSLYRFSINNKTMIPDPYFSIDFNNSGNYAGNDVSEKYNMLKSKKPGIKDFRPSALAFHPSGELYIISAAGRLLVVLDKQLKIKSFSYLSPEVFSQPEGLTFSHTGDMYISNEGRNGPGYILMFRE